MNLFNRFTTLVLLISLFSLSGCILGRDRDHGYSNNNDQHNDRHDDRNGHDHDSNDDHHDHHDDQDHDHDQ